ncbi:hypothetical protein CMUST_15850 (plasmid) [Corynebacterium mustelae]|uniref:Uncharacterized protein n=1 Tax=Corynebacterium mustelae TaxID=571915 RepID=A0A0G3GVN7_9CORY|nr:hypothetical protein [Corynebacterium mustelae]AKK05216.1 hypothetical protein CMUST_04370 [Corynebacterium mustelae]AKK07458.1 hypothetical protein CMUST_15850 [Corynebacterium mustelae]
MNENKLKSLTEALTELASAERYEAELILKADPDTVIAQTVAAVRRSFALDIEKLLTEMGFLDPTTPEKCRQSAEAGT